MSQDLVRNLLAAGGTTDAEGKVNYLLFVDAKGSFLNCQHWKGDTLAKQELLVDSVRANSTAGYLITPSEQLVICITPSSKLSAYTYDQDEREWVESDESSIAKYTVHPNGKLVACLDASGQVHAFFQDPSQRLISLDGAWTSSTLPAAPIAGTPISTLVTEDELRVYYISSQDNFIHAVVRDSDGAWKDSVATKFTITEEIKSFCIGNNELFVLTAKNVLLKVTVEGEKTKLGAVKDGKFVPDTVEEARITIDYYPNGRVKRRVIEGARVRHRGS